MASNIKIGDIVHMRVGKRRGSRCLPAIVIDVDKGEGLLDLYIFRPENDYGSTFATDMPEDAVHDAASCQYG